MSTLLRLLLQRKLFHLKGGTLLERLALLKLSKVRILIRQPKSFASKARIAVSVVLFTESKLTLQDDRHTKLKYLVAWLLGSGRMKDRER